jgi:hypothetical protein
MHEDVKWGDKDIHLVVFLFSMWPLVRDYSI